VHFLVGSQDLTKKEMRCGLSCVTIDVDEEVAARPPNQAKTTLDDSTSNICTFWVQVCEIRPKPPEMAQIGRFAAKQYGKFSRNWTLLRQGRTLAEIGGCSLAKVKQCWSLKQEIGRAKSGLPNFAHFR